MKKSSRSINSLKEENGAISKTELVLSKFVLTLLPSSAV
jgi:hypothetical protein